MTENFTIFAISTPPGKSGVAIIRISGNKASEALCSITKATSLPKARVASIRNLYDENDCIIDKALILWFPAPNSFTGENIVELHVHGSKIVIEKTLYRLSTIDNLRLAEPGEFSKRAFLNGKMDLTEAEGLADLIDAETELQHKQALRQYSGALRNLYEDWRKELIESLSFLEAFIDFPEEEIPSDIIINIESKVHKLKTAIQAHLNDNHKGERLRDGLYVTILGAPNVGK
jgi:tRNA modification GTPase